MKMMNKQNICPFCGKSFVKEFSDDAYYGKNCFDCSYWLKKVHLPEKYRRNQVIVNGEHFMIGPEEATLFKGMGGHPYTILFDDGRKVQTNNLWNQNRIPDAFRDLLPNNAVFVKELEPVSIDVEYQPDEIPF